jgi:hypothetical protein
VTGFEARLILLRQRNEELRLLVGEDGERYARFVGVRNRAGQIAWLREEIERLEVIP